MKVKIDFITDQQASLILQKKKIAFVRMECPELHSTFFNWREGKIIMLEIKDDEGRLNIERPVEYMDYFRWSELKRQPKLWERLGFKSKEELKKYLWQLYGEEMNEDSPEPYYYYIEF